MDKEFKFKGKRVDNGEWVEGYYFKTPLSDEATGSKPEDGWYFLCGKERFCISRNNCVYEVDPETVVPYIGLKDKNDKEIYNRDILKDEYGCGRVTYLPEHAAYVIYTYNNNDGACYHSFASGDCKLKFSEIVGNIFDNPELMEVEDC